MWVRKTENLWSIEVKLNNIFSKFKSSQKEEEKTFLAVEISLETIKSALWTIREGKTEIIKIGSLQEWDGENKELLLKAVDVSISNTCEKVKTEPQGLIFGLPKSWIKKEQITTEKKGLLKYICEKLELKPLGFVVILESLLAYLRNKEGTPVNGIFINLQEDRSLISLVQLGKIKGMEMVGRSQDLAADVKEGLVRFGKIENFPPRMIVFNSAGDFEEYKQQLTSYDWLEELSFLHFPKVEVLNVNESIKAIALAGGTEVAKSLGFGIKKEEDKPDGKKASLKTLKKTETAEKKDSADFGDARLDETDSQKTSDLTAVEKTSASDLGFVQDEDITSIEEKESLSSSQLTDTGNKEKAEIEKPRPEIKIKGIPQPFSLASKLTAVFKRIIFKLRLFIPKGKKRLSILIGICFFLLAGGAFAFYSYVPKAKVTIYLTPKTLEKELEMIIDGEQKNIEVEDKKTIPTTGERLIGDKAKGEVIIYNKTDVRKVFSSGAILIGQDNLRFILDEDVEIASKSSQAGDEGEQIIYGKTTAGVTAASIGTESNCTGGMLFSFKEYSANLFSAKTESGLSGGTSRQVKAVSSDDINLLLETLQEELKEKAKMELQKNVSSEKEILTEGMEGEILSREFSAEEGDETDELQLQLKINFSALIYDEEDLRRTLARLIKDEIPDDFVFDPEKAEIETDEVKVKDNKAEMIVRVKTHLLPKINFEEVKKNLAGRKPQAVQEYLQDLPNFSEADIEITPNLLGKLKSLPRLSKNIIIEIKVEE